MPFSGRYVLSKPCARELALDPTLLKQVSDKAAEACKSEAGSARGRCMDANFERFALDAAAKACPHDPAAIIPDSIGWGPRMGLQYKGKWFAQDGGYGGKVQQELISVAKTSAPEAGTSLSKEEEAVQGKLTQSSMRMYLMVGTGLLLGLALIKPRLKR